MAHHVGNTSMVCPLRAADCAGVAARPAMLSRARPGLTCAARSLGPHANQHIVPTPTLDNTPALDHTPTWGRTSCPVVNSLCNLSQEHAQCLEGGQPADMVSEAQARVSTRCATSCASCLPWIGSAARWDGRSRLAVHATEGPRLSLADHLHIGIVSPRRQRVWHKQGIHLKPSIQATASLTDSASD